MSTTEMEPDDQIRPWEGLTEAELLTKTSSEATVTHTPINGVVYHVEALPRLFGFTYHQRKSVMEQNHQRRTHCEIGGVALTWEELEATHNIQLGQE